MSRSALQACLEREHAQALAGFRLDDALGTHHGLSWADFVLLDHVSRTATGIPEVELAKALGVLRSRLLLRTRPLEKLGWLSRTDGGARLVALTASGMRLLAEARETAASVCAKLPSSSSALAPTG